MSRRAYRSKDWHYVTNRGDLAVVEADRSETRDELHNTLIGQEVCIDGEIYVCTGVESALTTRVQPGQSIGLLIQKQR